MGHNSVVSGYLTSTSFPLVDGWSTNPWVLGRHRRLPPVRLGVGRGPAGSHLIRAALCLLCPWRNRGLYVESPTTLF